MVSSFLSSLWGPPSPTPAPHNEQPPIAAQADVLVSDTPVRKPAVQSSQRREGLRAALFEAVKPTHASVAEHPFFVALKQKALTKPQLAAYLADQEHVLDSLETSLLMHADEAALRPMVDLRVTNRQGLAAVDAAALGFETLPPPTSAACRLAAEIGQLAQSQNFAAIAVHAWVQYNAMLNGGQEVAYALRKLFPETQMTLFSFTPPAAQMRRGYAQAINDVPVSQSDTANLCAHATKAFVANKNMLDDLMARRDGDIAQLFANVAEKK